jgi:hypothetical protein
VTRKTELFEILVQVQEKLEDIAPVDRVQKNNSPGIPWKQIGVLGTLEDKQLPFFIEWKSLDHPSTDGKAIAKIVKVEIAGDEKRITDWLGNDVAIALGSEVEVMWLSPADTEGESGIVAVHLMTPSGVVRVD